MSLDTRKQESIAASRSTTMSHIVPTVGAIEHLPIPSGGDIDRGPSLLGQFWTEVALGIVLLCMRFWSRIHAKILGWDDFFMLVTLVSPPSRWT